jgi:hypothetical protein
LSLNAIGVREPGCAVSVAVKELFGLFDRKSGEAAVWTLPALTVASRPTKAVKKPVLVVFALLLRVCIRIEVGVCRAELGCGLGTYILPDFDEAGGEIE